MALSLACPFLTSLTGRVCACGPAGGRKGTEPPPQLLHIPLCFPIMAFISLFDINTVFRLICLT